MPAWLLFIILVGGSTSVAWVATLKARRTFKQPVGAGHNDVAPVEEPASLPTRGG